MTLPPVAFRAAVLALLLWTAMPPAPAVGADAVELQARALMGGRFPNDGWLAIEVAVSNPGAPVEGHVTADGGTGEARRRVDLAGGARKVVELYLRPQPFRRQVDVAFRSLAGEELGAERVQVRSLEFGARSIAVVGDGAGDLGAQIAGAGNEARLVDITAADVPGRPEPLAGVDAIVWAADGADLDEAQRLSVERWIAEGGHLVVLGGADWQARTAAFDDLLPLTELEAVDGAATADLARWTEEPPPAEASAVTAASGTLRDGASALLALEPAPDDDSADPAPLLASRPLGAGKVTYIAIDMATSAFRSWPGSELFWSRLLPGPTVDPNFFGPVGGPASDDMIVAALGAIPALEVPPAELLLVLVVGYIALIGPVNYLVLRRLDRRDMAWLTAPLLVIVFSAGTYGIGTAMKGDRVILNELSVIRSSAGGTAASVQTYAGLFSPDRASYDITVRGDALLTALGSGSQFDFQGRPVRPSAVVEQGDPAHLRDLEVSVFGLQAVRADAVVAREPALEVSWSHADGGLAGSVRNVSAEPLADVAVVSASAGELIGDLAPGASQEFELRVNRFGGNPPSVEVYGFEDFTGGTDTTERLRRGVIDALTGWAGGPFGGQASFGPDGPLAIGWREAAGPVPVEVSAELQRFAQTVEIVAGRPALGSGQVVLRPAELSTTVIETEGGASSSDPGGLMIGEGSADLRISLPLEASGLRPSEIELLVGMDPYQLYMDPDNFAAFFPPGFQMAAFDRADDEWVMLGEIGQAGRFTLERPADYLSESGQLLVRVIGTSDAQGRMQVFVGAIVEGTLP